MLDLAQRCRLGVLSWIYSGRRCWWQRRACLKWPFTFHSLGNSCPCPYCFLRNSYRWHFLVACHQLVRCVQQLRIQSVPLVQIIQGKAEMEIFFFTPWVWLLWIMENLSSFFFTHSRLFCPSIETSPRPCPLYPVTRQSSSSMFYSEVEQLSWLWTLYTFTCSFSADLQNFNLLIYIIM